jgi:DNA replication protein DnaC
MRRGVRYQQSWMLLVIDDIGYVRKDEAETSVLFELVMQRYERKSLLVTSNQPFSEWENAFSTSAMTVAAVDRLVDHSTIIQINGDSYRRIRARQVGHPAANGLIRRPDRA